MLDKWTRALDEGAAIDIVNMDFMKAFDKIPHEELICKPESYGIHD